MSKFITVSGPGNDRATAVFPATAHAWLSDLKAGDQVWWNDPDGGLCSGYYQVGGCNSESGTIDSEETVVFLKNAAGAEAEVFASELSALRPEGLFPVVNVSSGSVAGYAASKEAADALVRACLDDGGADACLGRHVVLADGTTIARAWVATPSMGVSSATVRVTLDVTYTLNGESPKAMVERVQRMCVQCIGEGMLTGDTAAEMTEYAMEVGLQAGSPSYDVNPSRRSALGGNLPAAVVSACLAGYAQMGLVSPAPEAPERAWLL